MIRVPIKGQNGHNSIIRQHCQHSPVLRDTTQINTVIDVEIVDEKLVIYVLPTSIA
ncbi:Uncharacterised protein [Klebsiella pneumoniae]|nr:Uncharacterised protein [Klebsiella pneumoniae]